MKKILLSLVLLSFIIWGCKDNPVTSVNTSTEQHYELPIGNDSSLSHYYGVSFTENSGAVTGSAEIIDPIARHTGVISGTVNGSSYLLNADFTNDAYDFGFTGTKSGGIIAGQFHFINPVLSPVDTLNVALLSSNTKVLNFGDSAAPNPYLLSTIFTTPNPTGQPVIFVHGMGTSIVEWDSLFASLDAGFKSRHNVYAFQYNWQDSIMINGRILRDSVIAKGLVNPILVAHSMGGLVSRAYIASGGLITKLVTLSTPHKGTELADEIPILRPDMGTPGPNDMKVGGHFITSMLVDPLDLANRNKYYCIAGEMGGHFETTPPYAWVWNEPYYKDVMNGIVCTGWKLLLPFGKNDGLVNVSSSFFDGEGVNLPFPTSQLYVDHMHLVYPAKAPVVFNYINGL